MEPFKNWLNEPAVKKMATALKRADPGFPQADFLKNVGPSLQPLELKGRVLFLKERIHDLLPQNPQKSIPILVRALKQNEKDEVGLKDFLVWPLTQFVSDYGIDEFETSMQALYRMTQVFTAEFAIRRFLIEREKETLKQLSIWMKDPSDHVRRLVSEGSRPLLPWGQKIPAFVADPEKTWPLLEALKTDPAKYVQKSVANHINDHSKNHGDWVLQQLQVWDPQAESIQWIVRHATRTLVKKGHPLALKLHGVSNALVDVKACKIITPKIRLGQTLEVRCQIRNPGSEEVRVILDHEIAFRKANGKLSPKVFKGRKLQLKAGESQTLQMKIPIRVVTTRKYYAGTQTWALLANGKKSKALKFELEVPKGKLRSTFVDKPSRRVHRV